MHKSVGFLTQLGLLFQAYGHNNFNISMYCYLPVNTKAVDWKYFFI